MKVVTFGEPLVSFIAEELGTLHEIMRFMRSVAGAELNVAIGLARLGYSVGYISRVGSDAFGRVIMKRLRDEKVNIQYLSVMNELSTGFQLKSKVVTGDPEIQYFRKHSAAGTLDEVDMPIEYLVESEHIHMTGIPLAISPSMRRFADRTLSLFKGNGVSTFDPNLRPALWTSREEMISVVNDFACRCDWVLPGVPEGNILTGSSDPKKIAEYYLSRGVEGVVVKLGPDGAYVCSGGEELFIQGYEVKAIDTVGAGDGFAAGFISGLVDGVSLEDAVCRGNAMGALAVMSREDMAGYPTLDGLQKFMNLRTPSISQKRRF